ncbi:hypothetical protein ACMATS_05805 [Streptoverticillium reticulum]|uniref:hypothetical protein n=1 Tax=Streptoverticillium reticulum TaxID=1433415 RepID=UPI0039BF249E
MSTEPAAGIRQAPRDTVCALLRLTATALEDTELVIWDEPTSESEPLVIALHTAAAVMTSVVSDITKVTEVITAARRDPGDPQAEQRIYATLGRLARNHWLGHIRSDCDHPTPQQPDK